MKLLRATMLLLLLAAIAPAQGQRSEAKATEQVVAQYEKLVANGALLTPDGWKAASGLFYESNAYPTKGTIELKSLASLAMIGEVWVKGDRAEVQTKWTNDFGSIDSSLRYKPHSSSPPVVMTAFQFLMIYTNKHREIAPNGAVAETTGPWQWKIEGPQTNRWTTVARAVEYVAQVREGSDDPVLRGNAEKTIGALRRLHVGCGTASAC